MAYQNPAFYFYHGAREALSAFVSPASSLSPAAFFDGRQGEPYIFEDDYTAEPIQALIVERPNTPAADAVDHVLIAGHNLNLSEIVVFTSPTVVSLLTPNFDVTQANGVLIIIPLTTQQDVLPDHERVNIQFRQGTAAGSVVPEMGEVFLTTKREMSRGPEPGWDHPWVRSQTTFTNEAGVSSTWLKGSARKRFRLTWRGIVGADLQILLDLQAQTNDWSEPFYFQPPDDAFPTILMELERDGDWQQDFLNPQNLITHEVTLPLIEVKG